MKSIPVNFANQVVFCALLFGVSLGLTSTSTAQNQFYVNSNTGSDANDGSQTRPWKTIQHAGGALTLGSGGTTVHVAPGNYSGPITTSKSGTPSARIVFVSDTKWGAKISTMNWANSGSYVDIVGFEGTSPGGGGFALDLRAPNSVHVLNNYFHDFAVSSCESHGVINDGFGAASGTYSHDDWFIGNVVRHFGTYRDGGLNCNTAQGMYLDGARLVVENNVISGIAAWCIQRITYVVNSVSIGGPDVISNNTCFNNGGGIVISEDNGGSFSHGPPFDYSTIANNILINNGIGGSGNTGFGIDWYDATGTHNLVTNNLVYGNKPADYGHHGSACGTSASGSTPATGVPMTGSDGDGNSGGCPANNSQTDAAALRQPLRISRPTWRRLRRPTIARTTIR